MSHADVRVLAAACVAWLACGCHTNLQSPLQDDAMVRDAPDAGEPRDAAMDAVDPAIAQNGDPCVHAGRRACAGYDSKLPLVCRGGTWQPESPCDDDARCDTTDSAQRGRCLAIVHTFTSGHVSGNGMQTCAIDDAGAMFCWGVKPGVEAGDPSRLMAASKPAHFGAERWRDVSVGVFHACGIRDDGALFCWGRNCAGQLGDVSAPDSSKPLRVGAASKWQHVAVGGGHSCAIDSDGSLTCWGGADYGQSDCTMTASQAPTKIAGKWLQVAGQYYALYGVKEDGTLWRIWAGDNSFDGPALRAAISQIGSASWRVIDAGIQTVCGIRSDGSLACANNDDSEETQVGSELDWGDKVAGCNSYCATKQDGTLWCGGLDDNLQPGSGAASDVVAQQAQVGHESGWIALSANCMSNCGIRDGQVLCWGANEHGQLGIGDVPYRPAPAQVGSDAGWSAPTVGSSFSCALRSGVMECWGSYAWGAFPNALAPIAVPGTWESVQAGWSTLCAIDDSAALSCWGDGTQDRASLLKGTAFTTLGDGTAACALTADGSAWCLPGGYPAVMTPFQEAADIEWRALASSTSHRCGIAADGSLYCWGSNAHGELGVGTSSSTNEPPTQVQAGTPWIAVSAAVASGSDDRSYTCAITDEGASGGRLFCWGGGASGVLGNGTENDSLTPLQVGSANDWVAVAAGRSHACALNAGGELWCWGRNADGRLGIGAADDQLHRPERVGPGHAWSDVAVLGHTCATTTDGKLYCWGSQDSGALGEGSAWREQPTPIAL